MEQTLSNPVTTPITTEANRLTTTTEETKLDASLETPDKNTVLAVLQLLRKYNLKVCISRNVFVCSEWLFSNINKIITIVFQSTEEVLKREVNLSDLGTEGTESEVSSVLSAYKSEGDPDVYEEAYTDLKKFVEGALDIYKVSK